MKLAHLALLLLAAAGTRPLRGQETLKVASSLGQEVTQRGGLLWASGRPLTWADFSGTSPSTAGREAALTRSGFLYAMECDGHHIEYGVVAIFLPSTSWVKPVVLRDSSESARVLPHEQGHFNISELGARLFRQELLMFGVPCAHADSDFARLGQAAFARERALQERYDEETIHGTVPVAQARWLSWIAAQLDSLASDAEPYVARNN